MMVKSGLEFFILKPDNLPGQFNLSGQISFVLDSSNFEGARVEF